MRNATWLLRPSFHGCKSRGTLWLPRRLLEDFGDKERKLDCITSCPAAALPKRLEDNKELLAIVNGMNRWGQLLQNDLHL